MAGITLALFFRLAVQGLQKVRRGAIGIGLGRWHAQRPRA
jgi:hypothetical protein